MSIIQREVAERIAAHTSSPDQTIDSAAADTAATCDFIASLVCFLHQLILLLRVTSMCQPCTFCGCVRRQWEVINVFSASADTTAVWSSTPNIMCEYIRITVYAQHAKLD